MVLEAFCRERTERKLTRLLLKATVAGVFQKLGSEPEQFLLPQKEHRGLFINENARGAILSCFGLLNLGPSSHLHIEYLESLA